jgi:hypothetical protein
LAQLDSAKQSHERDESAAFILAKQSHRGQERRDPASTRKLSGSSDTAGRALVQRSLPESSEAVAKILRYGTTIERQLYRAIAELEKLQAARRHSSSPANDS